MAIEALHRENTNGTIIQRTTTNTNENNTIIMTSDNNNNNHNGNHTNKITNTNGTPVAHLRLSSFLIRPSQPSTVDDASAMGVVASLRVAAPIVVDAPPVEDGPTVVDAPPVEDAPTVVDASPVENAPAVVGAWALVPHPDYVNGCYNCGSLDHWLAHCPRPLTGITRCYQCGGQHVPWDCPSRGEPEELSLIHISEPTRPY